jgi:hypothetical protein
MHDFTDFKRDLYLFINIIERPTQNIIIMWVPFFSLKVRLFQNLFNFFFNLIFKTLIQHVE